MAKAPVPPKEIEFDFVKSNFFRVIRADGAFGGVSPQGAIHMAVYSERQPIPTKTVHKFEGMQLGPEIRSKRQGRKAIVREVEADIVLELGQAIILRDWLGAKIGELQAIMSSPAIATNGKESKKK
jgi:hypothetical protein